MLVSSYVMRAPINPIDRIIEATSMLVRRETPRARLSIAVEPAQDALSLRMVFGPKDETKLVERIRRDEPTKCAHRLLERAVTAAAEFESARAGIRDLVDP